VALQHFVGPWLLFQFLDPIHSRGISPSQGLYLHKRQHKHRINAHTDIHALSGIRTNDHRVRASEGISCFRPLSYCNRHTLNMPKKMGNVNSNSHIMNQPSSHTFKESMSQIHYAEHESLTLSLIRPLYHYVHIWVINNVFSCRNPSYNLWTHNAAAWKSKQIDIVENLNSVSR
jgi:hypothetical protein